ncbi:ribose-5-phosphate isomerase [Microbacterium dextranolyticum]|uniref:Ribose-5-phosphate isomerase B n=1 Tax=Microbacterium dextranolyticum TaxID=36806 RepID=A0A9W6HMR9_9MICO|nr:ribose-5-phosphate isomerase [Microbacterium dextranolyticum]MBM7462843.1 ribose 5-phosphate isomerase B [Microbacterium dextranolyticum]GLJ96052.1 ribose-5-phosphate isomerase [Microbacterium dextranolyticum]
MRIHIATDHAGLEFSTQLQHHLAEAGHEVIDHGPIAYDPVDDYPSFCIRAAQAVVRDQADGIETLGVVFGGSGNGEQIAANKVEGIRAALVWSIATAELAREHNDANVISIGARQHTVEEAIGFIDRFIATPFSGEERHARRIAQLADFERDGSLLPDPRAARPGADASGVVLGGESAEAFDPEAG